MSRKITRRKLYIAEFEDWAATVPKLLAAAQLEKLIPPGRKILLKPNLISDDPPPITTPVELVEQVIIYLRGKLPDAEIVVGEGSGSIDYETAHPFEVLGYNAMARKHGIALFDLNKQPTIELKDPSCERWPEFHLCPLVLDSFLISMPELKAHSMAGVTLSMKNMLGVAPPKYYNAGSWQKSAFHYNLQHAIADLNRYRKPDFVIIDATVGMQDAHLWGRTCDPPPNKLIATADPVAADACGTGLLGRDWHDVGHIKLSDGVIGFADPEEVVKL